MNTVPKIRVNGATSVRVDPINSFADLMVLSEKFVQIVDATPLHAVCVLSTATGDLAASVLQGADEIGFADEVASVMIAAATIAAQCGVRTQTLLQAMVSHFERETSNAVARSIEGLMEARGLSAQNV